MNESEFNDIVDDIFVEIEDAIEEITDETNIDIDYETSGGILTLTFSNASKIIINRQTPLKQIWVATRQGGFHFDYDESKQQWISHGKELFVALSEYCSNQAGIDIRIKH